MADFFRKTNQNFDYDKISKRFQLLNNHKNYKHLLGWCKQFGLLPEHVISEVAEAKHPDRYKFASLLGHIEDKIATSNSKSTIKTLENILNNLNAMNSSGLFAYTEEVHAEHLKVSDITLANKLCKSKSGVVPVYTMQHKNRGVLFFLNISHCPHRDENRSGSEYDKFYMISLFRKFGFTIYYYENLLINTFFELVKRLVKDHLDNTDSLVFIVTTHGGENRQIEFYYGERCDIFDILFKFNDTECPAMVGKPKVFLFPCCRGRNVDYGTTITIQTDGTLIRRPVYSDMLICYGTVEGFATNRDKYYGSWFIEAFYRVLAEKAHDTDLEAMLFSVTDTLTKIYTICNEMRSENDTEEKAIFQTPSYVKRDFNKLLYFNPGYVEE